MPEVNDLHTYLQNADAALLQRSSNQGWASRCYSCGSGVKSEFFNACLECRELLQDVKLGDVKAPLFAEASIWGAPENIPAAPIAAIFPEDHVAIPFAPPGNRVTKPSRAAPSDDSSRDPLVHARLSPRRSPSSPYRTPFTTRGRPPNGSRQGPPGFKGVRQRKGVRGYLVEIRPPKWKRTIWLGTYNTDQEAAGAYDAGIFYTKKKTKYNFSHLAGTFPPLPSQLRLDNPDDSEEIKTFVQKEARIAAQNVKALPVAKSSATSTDTTQSGPAASSTSASSEESSEPREPVDVAGNDAPLLIPLDNEWLHFEWPQGYNDVQASLFEDLMCNASFQQGGNLQAASWNMGVELKQEESSLDHEGLL